MNLTTMRARKGKSYNFDELFVKGINIFEFIKNAQANNTPYAPALVTITNKYTVDIAGAGYAVGDVLYATEVIDATNTPVTSNVTWVNASTKDRLLTPPSLNYLTLNTEAGSVTQTKSTVFTGTAGVVNGTDGLVPAPTIADVSKYLRSDGIWATLPVPVINFVSFTGTNGVAPGITGAVPAPKTIDINNYLRGDGTWAAVPVNTTPLMVGATANSPSIPGTVPVATAADKDKFLTGAGTWSLPVVVTTPVYVGASGSSVGTTGTVPAAGVGEKSKFLKGDGTWSDVPVVTTPALVGSSSTTDGMGGITPAPAMGDQTKFLRGDGTWAYTPVYQLVRFTGATSSLNGVLGGVPAPLTSDIDKFLKGDGTWSIPTFSLNSFTGTDGITPGAAGSVPAPKAADKDKFLKGDGSWGSLATAAVPVMVGASNTVDGESGLVPKPIIASYKKFLRGDGNWVEITSLGVYDASLSYAAGDRRYYAGVVVEANSTIAAGSSFSWGASGATWKPWLPSGSGLTWKGVWSSGSSNAVNDLVAQSSTGLYLYTCVVAPSDNATPVTDKSYWSAYIPSVSPTINNLAFTGASALVAGLAGLVPKPIIGDKDKFLKGDGTWSMVPTYTGATALSSGIVGMVPTASAAERNLFLKGDGSWALTPVTSVTNYVGATSSASGVAGLVPSADTSAIAKFLRGDGAWATPASTVTSLDVISAINTDKTAVQTALGLASTDTVYTAKQTFTGSSNSFGAGFVSASEKVTVSAGGISGAINYDIGIQSVMLYQGAASSNWTINFRMSSTAALDAALAVGQSSTVTLMATQGATAYYPNAFSIDGVTVTPKWIDGITPAAGNVNAIDSYTFTIIKTGSAAYTVLATQSTFK